ncbi:nitronate monooxygenase family protein [Bacillus sp. S/N-304-OC-R1]|uniref:NAD(P)H-dependent flavin oxidoreductase n=1 Tax=Bacillus sp. S/N-304-OC-R1 TaxID=2758034 RepID=UPI001C8E7424|nr:nitronate monooxygenase [Bacillus sp. S/N-304-OC-R1]MBY0122211.1 nitronate monooxygenase [Bacillus sp. S/N-304-OC-R1]
MEWKQNEITEKLGISYPIFQAPMAGGITTSKLVSETSNFGGLGNIGAGYMSPEEMEQSIQEIRLLTSKPFGINLFVPNQNIEYSEEEYAEAQNALLTFKNELGINDSNQGVKQDYTALYEKQVEVVLKLKVPVCSFTFGIPSDEVIKELKNQGIVIIGTATNVKEAIELEKSGVDMIVAQGSEAGGHRGTFHEEGAGLIGLMALIPQVADAVKVPVIAAGGIMDARGIAAAFLLGAKGVQLGTAFLTCKESGTHHVYKNAILNSTEEQTTLTKAFSGKLARGIKNRFIGDMNNSEKQVLPFPVQNDLTGLIRKQAAQLNNPDYMSLWAGQGVRLAKETTVRELMERLIKDYGKL